MSSYDSAWRHKGAPTLKAYHFLKADFTAGEGNEPPWEVGETRTIEDASKIALCNYGYHSSPTLWGALQYAHGPLACLVEVSEPLFKDIDKQISQSRQLLKAVNIERELRLYACDCAERVLHVYEKDHPTDKRPREAINTARAYVIGKASKEQLAAAWAACAVRHVTQGACAIRHATQAAAWTAAWAVSVARDVAGDAEVQWQRQHWDEMFGKLFD